MHREKCPPARENFPESPSTLTERPGRRRRRRAPRGYPLLVRYRLRYELLTVRRVLFESDHEAEVYNVLRPLHAFALLEPRVLFFVDDLHTGASRCLRPSTPF